MRTLMQIAEDARRSKYAVAKLGTNDKNRGILAIADTLMSHADEIIAANRIDIENGRAAGLNDGLIDRLMLDEKRIAGIAEGCRQVAALPDPVGEVLWMHKRPNGLNIGQKRVPMGVIGIIYEARPNVTVDAAVLCFKAGSACILRGGKEAFQSSMCLTRLMREALAAEGLPENAINLVEDTSRDTATQMMKLNGYLDVLIPRGGAGLIRSVVMNATVPVIETGTATATFTLMRLPTLRWRRIFSSTPSASARACARRQKACSSTRTLRRNFCRWQQRALHLIMWQFTAVRARWTSLVTASRPRPMRITAENTSATKFRARWSIRWTRPSSTSTALTPVTRSVSSPAIMMRRSDFLRKWTRAAVYVNASTRFTDGFEFGFWR